MITSHTVCTIARMRPGALLEEQVLLARGEILGREREVLFAGLGILCIFQQQQHRFQYPATGGTFLDT